ncbi:MAG: pyruvate carboxylase subunit B [Candidatus Borkfalkiaceae bacterium]|nr:pyruvate carboxylase subunit B [Christensenellaceae bacterium]
MAKKVLITDTILRDAHQSQAATRMTIDQMLPALDRLDDIGYYSLEAWGGATFDSCLRFLHEDPWERLRILKSHLKKTPIQMLLRGQNLLGYKHYADDVVEKFVEYSIKNGVTIIRVFDALNDVRNLETAMKAIKKYGGVCEATISYTTSPVHTNEYFVKLAKTLESMGADNICLKDMANLLLPYTAYDLIRSMKAVLKPETKIHLHTHNTTGTGDMVYLKAIEAGCDIVDTALSALGNGTSQPATEPLVATLKGTPYDTGIDLNKLVPLTNYFKTVAAQLESSGALNPNVRKVDINTLVYQVPGGMLSNLMNQLKQQGKLDKLDEVLAEVPNVRKDCGYPPLVTPSSQIVGTQAVLNVLSGERYKMVTKEFKALLKGEYGQLPSEPDPDVVKKIVGNEKIVTCRPADLIAPEYEKYKAEISQYYTQEEDVLSYALFNEVALNFFKWRMAKNSGIDKDLADNKDKVYPV